MTRRLTAKSRQLDEAGRPSFNVLQNYGSSQAPVFLRSTDVLVLEGQGPPWGSLDARRKLLAKVMRKLKDPHSGVRGARREPGGHSCVGDSAGVGRGGGETAG